MKVLKDLLLYVLAFGVLANISVARDQANSSVLSACKDDSVRKWDQCIGTHTYPNGNVYTGEFRNGLRHGFGRIRILAKGSPDRDGIRSEVPSTYEGQFKNGVMSGLGVLTLDTGERYEGNFLNNVYQGKKQDVPNASPKFSGSGFFVASDGLFVTNWHVVEGAKTLIVAGFDGKRRSASVVGRDYVNDLAVLRVAGTAENWLVIAQSGEVKRGTEVITVGYPNVKLQGFEPKVTSGVISSLSGIADDPRMFQISVPIQPGNSGGALVTRDGSVVGVVSAKLSQDTTKKLTGKLPENVNYAIKSNYLIELLKSHAVRGQLSISEPQPPKSPTELVEMVERASGIVFAFH